MRHDAGYAAAACIAFLREEVVGAAPDTTLATTRGVLGRTPPPEARPALGLWSLRVAVRGASGGG